MDDPITNCVKGVPLRNVKKKKEKRIGLSRSSLRARAKGKMPPPNQAVSLGESPRGTQVWPNLGDGGRTLRL